jgi:hypothetical protein
MVMCAIFVLCSCGIAILQACDSGSFATVHVVLNAMSNIPEQAKLTSPVFDPHSHPNDLHHNHHLIGTPVDCKYPPPGMPAAAVHAVAVL